MSQPENRPPRRPDILLSDLTGELLWPALFRAASLALRPERLLIALCTIVALGIIGSLSTLWSDAPSFGHRAGEVLGGLAASAAAFLRTIDLSKPWELPIGQAATAAQALLIDAPGTLMREYPASTFVLGLPMLVVLLLGWGAIVRSASMQFGLEVPERASASVAEAVRRLQTLVKIVVGPLVGLAAVALLYAAIGWVLLSLPVVDLLGAVLFGPGLLISVLIIFVAALWLVSLPMTPAAVMCEGPDPFDALQRGLAYVVARPLRYLLYVLVLIAVGAVLAGLLSILIFAADSFATIASTAFLSDDVAAGLREAPGDADGRTAVHAICDFWRSLLKLGFASFVLSYAASGSTVLYLLMRRLVDGQTPADMPGA